MPQTTSTGPNLTMIAYLGRQSVKFGSIALVALIVGRTLFSAFSAYWKAAHPPPPPPPTVGFGRLPALVFPEQSAEDKPTSFTLETASGTLPEFGDRAKVFLMTQSSPSLLADQKAKEVAADYGFVFEPSVLDSRRYRWTKSQPLESTLEIDIQSLSHTLMTDYLSRPELLSNNEAPDPFDAVAQVKSALKKVDLLPADVATASGETVFMKAVGGKLEPAVSQSDADYLQVDLNRQPVDNRYVMFTPKGYQGTVRAIVAGSERGDSAIMELEYHYQPADYSQVHTYPLRSTQSAWKVLQAGEGYIAALGSSDQAVIRNVYLGYFDSFEEQAYLQPIIVFEGDGGLLGYVPALDPTVVVSDTTELE